MTYWLEGREDLPEFVDYTDWHVTLLAYYSLQLNF